MTVSDQQLTTALRALAMDAVEQANSGHPGMPLGMADVALVLFRDQLKFVAGEPHWADRDRFVLSAGHGSMLLYSLLYLTGYADLSLDALRTFRRLGSVTAGHPEYGSAAGIETTTGPLGQGLANAVGMAIAEELLASEYGSVLFNHRTWVIAGDGCLMEGISHEAISLAGHLRLAKLTVLFDDNHISIDGDTALAVSDDTLARFTACGWNTESCNGHDSADISRALAAARAADRPTLVACRTVIGYGAPAKQGTAATHGAPLGAAEVAATRRALDWPHEPFVIPDEILAAWRGIGSRQRGVYDDWCARLQAHPERQAITARLAGALPPDWDAGWRQWRDTLNSEDSKMATRQASGKALEQLVPALPALIGGSADLTGSNNTHVGQAALTRTADGKLTGRYIHYGVREHAMAAIMNGLALHGGFIPYGGTFLVFSDYFRPAARLAALMQLPVVFVLTHDSIGLGEDGPTHQPVEHLAALRLIPELTVFRPCDVAETAECWRLALLRRTPCVLALSRQALPLVSAAAAAQCARGAYIVSAAENRQLTLAASGSEVSLALTVQQQLQQEGIAAAVVSVPSMELFAEQEDEYRRQVLPPDKPLLAIEAASAMPWQALAARAGIRRVATLCLESFGASGPAADVFKHFDFTPAAAMAQAARLLTPPAND